MVKMHLNFNGFFEWIFNFSRTYECFSSLIVSDLKQMNSIQEYERDFRSYRQRGGFS